jgi:glycosyltransferase involved in cell wall biosynthesis
MRKKLLIATENFLPRWDGIARFLNEIIPKLCDEYDITVIAPRFSGEIKGFDDINLIRIPISGMKFGDYSPAKIQLGIIKREVKKADIIWTQTIGTIGIPSIIYARFYKKPLLAYIHSVEWELFSESLSDKKPLRNLIYSITKFIAMLLYNQFNILLVPSLEVAELFSWHNIKTKKKVVYLGTNTFKFIPPESKKDAKEKIGIDPKKVVIGFSGRIGREKDLITLYRAFLRLRKLHPNIVLLIVGKGVQELRVMLESKKDIIVVEYAENIIPYLQAMDIYVMPSLTETSSLSTMEAMSCGLAVVSTKVGNIKNYIKDNYNGIFFKKQDAYQLSKKIEYLLQDKERRISLGQNARKTIVQLYDWKKTAEEIKKVLNNIKS